MRRRPSDYCGVKNYSCKKLPKLSDVFKDLQTDSVSKIYGTDITLSSVQAIINSDNSTNIEANYTNIDSELLSNFYYNIDQSNQTVSGVDDNIQSGSITKQSQLKKCYSNFLNLPRVVQGIVYRQDIADLSTLSTNYLAGVCYDNLNILSNRVLDAQSKAFTDLFESMRKWYQNIQNPLDTVSTHVIKKLLTNQQYLDEVEIDTTDKDKNIYWLHRLHMPGVIIPRLAPQPIDLSSVAFTAAPSYTISSVSNINKNIDITKELQQWPGCSGPGVFFRPSQGSTPQFICLSQCL